MGDLLRLELIWQHGGLYVDVDFECLRPFDSLHHRYSFYTGMSNVGAFELNNGLFAAGPRHPVLKFLREHVGMPWPAWGQADVDPKEAVAYQLEQSGMLGASLLAPPAPPASGDTGLVAAFLATTGPGFFTRGVLRALMQQSAREAADGDATAAPCAVKAPEVFYPLSNSLRERPLAERRAAASANSMAIHHWCRTWAPSKA